MHTLNIYKTIILLLLSVNIAFSQEQILESNKANDTRVEELANIIETAIHNSDPDTYLSRMDFNIFGQNITIDSKNSSMEDNQKALLKGFLQALKQLPKKLINDVENGNHYDLVSHKYNVIEKSYYILFRLFSIETGLNYHNYKVYEVDDELMFGDIYIYSTGETITNTFSRMYVNSLPKNKLSKLFGQKKLKEFQKMISGLLLYKSGKSKKAYDLFNNLNSDITKEKYFLIIKSQIASEINDVVYKKTLKEIIDTHPNDPTLYLNYVDYYILQNDYESALDILEQLEFQTNDDFLAYMKGNLELERGQYEKSSELLKYVTENYPDFFEGVSSYLLSLTYEKKYANAILLLEDLINKGYTKVDLVNYVEENDESGENVFESLIESQAFIDWKD